MSWVLFAFAYLYPVTAGDVRSELRFSLEACLSGPAVVATQGCSGRFDRTGNCRVTMRDVATLFNLATLAADTEVSPELGIVGVTRCTMYECFDDPAAGTACWSGR
jgi:hypothetical protein